MTDTADMKIKALAPWFGGKRTLAPRIVAELGKHHSYWEPFAGGIAILPAKPRSRMETLNDLHRHLINLARVAQSDELSPRLFDRAMRTAFCEAIYNDCRSTLEAAGDRDLGDEPDLNLAYAYLVTCWMGRNGMAGLARCESNFCVRYTANGGDPGARFARVAESLPAWWERLRGVTILCRDASEVIEKIEDAAGVVIYLDPPYWSKTVAYRHDFAAGGFWCDHERLRDALRRFKSARVVVSYYDCPQIRSLYAGWTFVDCAMNKATAQAASRGGADTEAPEVLIINGPSYTEGQ